VNDGVEILKKFKSASLNPQGTLHPSADPGRALQLDQLKSGFTN